MTLAQVGWRILLAVGAIALVTFSGFTAYASSHSTAHTRVEFTDKAGRHCTQVGTTALDCDYPPAENRIGDALNGLVNP